MLDEHVKAYLENSRKIQKVAADEEYDLILTFDNGEIRKYPMRDELEGVFTVLRDKSKFQTAFLDEFGNVAWNIDESTDSGEKWTNRIDLCKDALYLNSVPVKG